MSKAGDASTVGKWERLPYGFKQCPGADCSAQGCSRAGSDQDCECGCHRPYVATFPPVSSMRIEAGWMMHLLARREGVRDWHHADAWCWCGNAPDAGFYPKNEKNLELKWGPKP